MSFRCENCGFTNCELQSGSKIQERGVTYKVKVKDREDLNLQIVKSDTATLKVPELDLEVPADSQVRVPVPLYSLCPILDDKVLLRFMTGKQRMKAILNLFTERSSHNSWGSPTTNNWWSNARSASPKAHGSRRCKENWRVCGQNWRLVGGKLNFSCGRKIYI